jgi:hypothetical protein
VLHPDSDDLALLALGESLGDPVDTHVAHCEICQHEIDSFQQTIGLAELSNYGENAPPVSEHVWQAITAELGLTGSAMTNGDTVTAHRAGGLDATPPEPVDIAPADTAPVDTAPVDTAPVDTAPAGSDPVDTDPVDPDSVDTRQVEVQAPTGVPVLRAVPELTEPRSDASSISPGATPEAGRSASDLPAVAGPPTKRWSRWVTPLAAAVVGIALGAGAVAVLQNRSTADTVEAVEAVAPLKPVPTGPLAAKDGQLLGQADLVASPTGPQVRVNAADLPAADTSAYEVWLFGDNGKMVSLGTLSDGNGSFTVPPGISTQEYRVVDISDEPPDGNPAHSGVSLIRGEFS